MTLWMLISILAAVWTAVIVRVLVRSTGRARTAAAYDAAVYKDQLDELDRDIERGIMSVDEAAGARVEISRKLIAASQTSRSHNAEPRGPLNRNSRIPASLVALLMPLAAFFLYNLSGSPSIPDRPFAARQAAWDTLETGRFRQSAELRAAVRSLEAQLEVDPDNLDVWRRLAQSRLALGDFEQAAAAFDQAMKLSSRSVDLLTGKGIVLVFRDGGRIDDEARSIFEEVLAKFPDDPTGLYFSGLAHAQRQEFAAAADLWRRALTNASSDWPLSERLRQQLTLLEDSIAPTQDDIEAAAAMDEASRRQMIDGMVEGLAARLAEDPDDLEGWLRLARSYVVLDRKDDAVRSLAKAKAVFADDDRAVGRIDAARQDLGLSD